MSKNLTTIVISRNLGQSIHIGQDVIVTLTQIKDRRAQITVQAPADLAVLRGEKILNVVNRNKPKSTG